MQLSILKQVSRIIDGVNVTVIIPEPTEEKLYSANGAFIVLQSVLPIIQKHFGQYPCKNLYVSIESFAGGGAGMISIGSLGVAQPWLLTHELTHSYFSSAISGTWLAEGAAGQLQNLIYFPEVAENLPQEWILYFNASVVEGGIPGLTWQFEKNTSVLIYQVHGGWRFYVPLNFSRRQLEQAKEEYKINKPICQLSDYINASYGGRIFLGELYLEIGKQNLINALRSIYEKTRFTNEEASSQDICKAILYYTPENKKEKVKSFLNYELCDACG